MISPNWSGRSKPRYSPSTTREQAVRDGRREAVSAGSQPRGDRKVLEFELTVYEGLEANFEALADKLQTVQFLADAALRGVPLDHAFLEEVLGVCEKDLLGITQQLEALRQRKAQVQQDWSRKADA